MTRVAVVREAAIAAGPGQLGVIQALAPSFGVELRPIDVRDPGEIERAITAFARGSNDGLIVTQGARPSGAGLADSARRRGHRVTGPLPRMVLHLLRSPIGAKRRSSNVRPTSALWGEADLKSALSGPPLATPTGRQPDRNPALQRAPDLAPADTICCREVPG